MDLIHGLHGSVTTRFRRARSRHVVGLIEAASASKQGVRILDVGGEHSYWQATFDRSFLEQKGVHITLVNLQTRGLSDPLFSEMVGDACNLSQFADDSFDLVHSNSVIEHVGDWVKVEEFANEVRRLAPLYYVQTPYQWFPVEPHFSAFFFHWRSEHARAKLLLKRRYGYTNRSADIGQAMRSVQHARLLDKAQFRFLFPDAQHVDERIAGLTKSLMAIRKGRA